MLPVATDRNDRLPPMLFVATLFYALLILGITFDVGLLPESSDTTSLEVTIVTDVNPRTARPDDADYLAQANQQGNGNTRERVTPGAAPLAPGQVDMPIEEVGDVQMEAAPGNDEARDLLASTAQANRRLFRPEDIGNNDAEQAREALITEDNPRHQVVSELGAIGYRALSQQLEAPRRAHWHVELPNRDRCRRFKW